MIRRIIHIDQDKCNGCGACAQACHEGAIAMVDGKAQLIRDDYCDGLGDCLPTCPTGAITFVEREAAPYDEAAVKANMAAKAAPCACPGSMARALNPQAEAAAPAPAASQLLQWPVQIKLAPVNAPYFQGAHLLIAADCTAYAYANFHQDFIRGKVTLIGCPKLDMVDYTEKLTAMGLDFSPRFVYHSHSGFFSKMQAFFRGDTARCMHPWVQGRPKATLAG